jgi:hypothetical protein
MMEGAVQARTVASRGERERFTVRLMKKEGRAGRRAMAARCEPRKTLCAPYDWPAQRHGTQGAPS